jgi:hypothetical protein
MLESWAPFVPRRLICGNSIDEIGIGLEKWDHAFSFERPT